MTPIGASTSGSAWFLNGLADLQQQELQTQKEISSGYQIQDAADSPAQTPELITLGSNLAAVQAYQTNLASVQTEASAADQALGSGISLLQSAITTGEQGASSTSTATSGQNLAAQIQSVQQQIASIANTTVDGRYIFGGDLDQSTPFSYSAAGITSLTNPTSTRTIVDTQGQTVYQSLTAQQIFNPLDPVTGAPTANNTVAALQSLETALGTGIQANVATAVASLQTAATYVNQQQACYGIAENRIASEQNSAANQVTALTTSIGAIRDTNVAQAATELSQETADQSAAYGAQAEISTKSLFDYLG